MPKLSWDSAGDFAKYEMHRSLNSQSNFEIIATVSAQNYTDYTVRIHPQQGQNNQTAYYKVRATLDQQTPPDTLFPRVVTSFTNSLSTDYWLLLKFGSEQVASIGLRPTDVLLMPNYPNPFNAGTTVPFRVENSTVIDLTIFDILARPVRILYSGRRSSGEYLINWDGKDSKGVPVATGTYFIILDAGGQRAGVSRVNLVK